MRRRRPTEPPADEPVELAALADGSLPPERAAELEGRVSASPELGALLAEQERAVALTRDAGAQTAAPAGLRRRIEVARPGRPRRRLALGAGAAAVVAVAAVAVALVLPSGAGGPSAAEAAVFGGRPATAAAPRVASRPALLLRLVDGVPFPNLARAFGWHPVGLRVDALEGRRAVTVFYEKAGRRIAYTIVSGARLHEPDGVRHLRRGAVELGAFRAAGRLVVDVVRAGRTCLLSGAGVGRQTLAALAAWNGGGAVPF